MAPPIILIHGTWGSGESWSEMKGDLEELGLEVHAPSLRYHDLPYKEALESVGDVSLADYRDDIIRLVETCEEPPILVGHSMGCLIAQMVAEKVEVVGLILLGPAPTADIFAFYPSMVQCFAPHFLQWDFWGKPIIPTRRAMVDFAMQEQDPAFAEETFSKTVPDSGRAYTEMALPFLDPQRTSAVDRSKISCPVLILTGSKDRMTVPQIARETAKKFGDQAQAIMMDGADHYYIAGRFKDQTLFHMKRWLANQNFLNK